MNLFPDALVWWISALCAEAKSSQLLAILLSFLFTPDSFLVLISTMNPGDIFS
jgi:hypothetical protein